MNLTNSKEKISIIVPVYKVEKYLKKCVDSIRNQTYTNLEIILVDDGSPDECGKMCDEYAKEDDRIKVIHKENGGLSSARNTGIDNATGEYVAFVDSDDFVSNDYCEILYNLLIENDSDVSAISYLMFKEEDAETIKRELESEKNIIIYENQDVIKEMLNKKTFQNIVWNKLYKRELVEKHKFPTGVNYEDVFFSYEVLTDIKRIVYKDIQCYFYLKRESSISSTISEKNLKDFLDVVLHKFNGIRTRFPDFEVYNHYAFFESIVAISSLYVRTDTKYLVVENGLEDAFEEMNKFISKYESQFLPLLNDFQKACLYMIKYNKDLYYSFLREYRKLKKLGKIK